MLSAIFVLNGVLDINGSIFCQCCHSVLLILEFFKKNFFSNMIGLYAQKNVKQGSNYFETQILHKSYKFNW